MNVTMQLKADLDVSTDITRKKEKKNEGEEK